MKYITSYMILVCQNALNVIECSVANNLPEKCVIIAHKTSAKIVVLNNEAWMLPCQPNVENIFHERLPVDWSNCFSTSVSDSVSILSASDSAWAALSLRIAFVGVEMPGSGGAASSSSSDRQDIGN